MYIIVFIILIVDQLTKWLAVQNLKGQSNIVIIKDFIELTYLENKGAAFGIFENQMWLFGIMTVIVLVGLIFILRYIGKESPMLQLIIYILMGGAVGNFIDRMRLGYVVDFISVKFKDAYSFPVFNIADIAIVVSSIMIIFLMIRNDYKGNTNVDKFLK